MEIIKWMADQVQNFTGEKERREDIKRLKQVALDFKNIVEMAIEKLNSTIQKFNEYIKTLNNLRNSKVKKDIHILNDFLRQFGNCKEIGEYVPEESKLPENFPEHQLENINDYIANVDWSKEDVFLNTFFLTPIGIKIKTRKQNLSMKEQINDLQLLTENKRIELETREFNTEIEIEICQLYIKNVEFISNYISKYILPELEVVEAFFQAERIKNEIITEHAFKDISFSYNINAIADTRYDSHYKFIKNTYMFYIISCCIYNTPVLTKLLKNEASKNDIVQLNKEHEVLTVQANNINANLVINKG